VASEACAVPLKKTRHFWGKTVAVQTDGWRILADAYVDLRKLCLVVATGVVDAIVGTKAGKAVVAKR